MPTCCFGKKDAALTPVPEKLDFDFEECQRLRGLVSFLRAYVQRAGSLTKEEVGRSENMFRSQGSEIEIRKINSVVHALTDCEAVVTELESRIPKKVEMRPEFWLVVASVLKRRIRKNKDKLVSLEFADEDFVEGLDMLTLLADGVQFLDNKEVKMQALFFLLEYFELLHSIQASKYFLLDLNGILSILYVHLCAPADGSKAMQALEMGLEVGKKNNLWRAVTMGPVLLQQLNDRQEEILDLFEKKEDVETEFEKFLSQVPKTDVLLKISDTDSVDSGVGERQVSSFRETPSRSSLMPESFSLASRRQRSNKVNSRKEESARSAAQFEEVGLSKASSFESQPEMISKDYLMQAQNSWRHGGSYVLNEYNMFEEA